MALTRLVRGLLTPRSVIVGLDRDDNQVQELPFVVRPVGSVDELARALALRDRAYSRHLGTSASRPDEFDFAPNALLLGAFQKSTGAIVGSMRVAYGTASQIETALWHPQPRLLAGHRLADARRLCVRPGRMATLVKLALWKAFWQAAMRSGTYALLAAARPPLNEDYRMLMFREPVPGGVWFTPPDVDDPHEMLMLTLHDIEERWLAHSHAMHRFIFVTAHPDIMVDAQVRNPLAGLSTLDWREDLIVGLS